MNSVQQPTRSFVHRPVSRAQVSGVLSFPALTSASLYFRRCNCLSLPMTCLI